MKWKKRRPIIKYNEDHDILCKLASIRGIEDYKSFFDPQQDSLHDPYLLKNIDTVANRIIKAIYEGEKIVISADCDTDGITATAVMYRYLKPLVGEDNLSIAYHQRASGHGVENQQINKDTDLLIILDSSTNSTEACKEISERGTDIVIIDHHEFEKENPYAVIVNPQMDDYPNKSISGAGLVYKLLQVIDDTIMSDEVCADDFIDLVGVGMYADQMDMSVMENRYIVKQALENIKNPGLEAIIRVKDIDKKYISSMDIGFSIAPLINGTTRLNKIELCFDLFLEDDLATCVEIAKEMDALKNERQEKEMELFEAYDKQVNPDDRMIIVTDKNASKNFNGLIAMKLAEKYKRPAMVLKEDEKGYLTGSFRSYGGFKLKSVLGEVKLLHYALGHEEAGGVRLKKDNLNKLRKIMNDKLKDIVFSTELEYDIALEPDELSMDLMLGIEKFNYITGNGFPRAKVVVKGLDVEDRVVIGKKKDTVRFDCDGLKCIKFKVDENWAEEVGCFDEIDVIGDLRINRWYNYKERKMVETKQLIVDDYQLN